MDGSRKIPLTPTGVLSFKMFEGTPCLCPSWRHQLNILVDPPMEKHRINKNESKFLQTRQIKRADKTY